MALVIALDTSSSIDVLEFTFQQQAVISALENEEVSKAMSLAGTVDISVIYWADPGAPVQETGFFRIKNRNDAKDLTNAVKTMLRRTLGNTGLSTGLNAALDRLATVCAHRRIINVSGDGKESIVPRKRAPYPGLKAVKERATAENVTINALVVGSDEPHLVKYFGEKVIVGEGAFVMGIADFSDYAEALRRKLIREIAPIMLSQKHDD